MKEKKQKMANVVEKKAAISPLKCICKRHDKTIRNRPVFLRQLLSFFDSTIHMVAKKMQLLGTLPAGQLGQLLIFGCNIQYPTLYVGPKVGSANPGELIHVEPSKKRTSKIKSKTTRQEDKKKKDAKEKIQEKDVQTLGVKEISD